MSASPAVYPSNAAAPVEFPAPLDPDDQGVQGVDYLFDWGPWLDGHTGTVTVASGTVTAVDGGLTITGDAPTIDARGVAFWAKVATAKPGAAERVECQIVDSEGRPQTRTGIIRVAQR